MDMYIVSTNDRGIVDLSGRYSCGGVWIAQNYSNNVLLKLYLRNLEKNRGEKSMKTIDLGTKRYLKKCSRRKPLPENYEEILEDFARRFGSDEVKIIYRFSKSRCLNANSGRKNKITVNEKWAELLVREKDNTEVINAFRETIGHELTHKENDLFPLKYIFISHGLQFTAWTNEVHADFGGVKKALEGDAKKGLRGMRFKCKDNIANKFGRCCVKSDCTHPSWLIRMDMIKKRRFNAERIKEIAKLAGCKNKALINKVCEHYDVIELG